MPSAARSPLFQLLAAVLVAVFVAFLAAGCGGTDPAPGKTLHISSSMRASCPEHPFKPEFQGVSALRAGGPAAGKSAAGAAIRAEYLYQVEIYDDGGDLVVEWSGSFDSQDPRANPRILWAGTDSRGRPVPSGYYYMRIRIEDNSGGTETGTTCSFYVNPEDSDKLK
jgi:hypothetical protein